MSGNILLVEDDGDYRTLLADYLGSLGHSVVEFVSAQEALGHIQSDGGRRADLVLTDLRTAGGSGLELAAAAKQACPELPIIVMSASDDRRLAGDARRAAVDAFLEKPFRLAELARLVGSLLAHRPDGAGTETPGERASAKGPKD